MTTTEEIKRSFYETTQKINEALAEIKKSNASDQLKIEYMEKIFKLQERHLLATAELSFALSDLNLTHIKQIDQLNKKLDWVYYDRDCAIYQLMAHNADHPKASEQDKLAFSRAVYPEPPKHKRV